jgi:hypothetical protein
MWSMLGRSECGNEPRDSIKGGKIVDNTNDCQLIKYYFVLPRQVIYTCHKCSSSCYAVFCVRLNFAHVVAMQSFNVAIRHLWFIVMEIMNISCKVVLVLLLLVLLLLLLLLLIYYNYYYYYYYYYNCCYFTATTTTTTTTATTTITTAAATLLLLPLLSQLLLLLYYYHYYCCCCNYC